MVGIHNSIYYKENSTYLLKYYRTPHWKVLLKLHKYVYRFLLSRLTVKSLPSNQDAKLLQYKSELLVLKIIAIHNIIKSLFYRYIMFNLQL